MLTSSTQAGKMNRAHLSAPANSRNDKATMKVIMDIQRGTAFVLVQSEPVDSIYTAAMRRK